MVLLALAPGLPAGHTADAKPSVHTTPSPSRWTPECPSGSCTRSPGPWAPLSAPPPPRSDRQRPLDEPTCRIQPVSGGLRPGEGLHAVRGLGQKPKERNVAWHVEITRNSNLRARLSAALGAQSHTHPPGSVLAARISIRPVRGPLHGLPPPAAAFPLPVGSSLLRWHLPQPAPALPPRNISAPGAWCSQAPLLLPAVRSLSAIAAFFPTQGDWGTPISSRRWGERQRDPGAAW